MATYKTPKTEIKMISLIRGWVRGSYKLNSKRSRFGKRKESKKHLKKIYFFK